MTANCLHLALLYRKLLLPPQSNLIAHSPWVNLYLALHSARGGYPSAPLVGSVILELRTETVCILPWSLYLVLGLVQDRNAVRTWIKYNLLAIRKWNHLFFGFRKKGCWHAWRKLHGIVNSEIYFSRELVDSMLERNFHVTNPNLTSDRNTRSVTSGDELCGPWAFHMAPMILIVSQPVAVKQTQMLIWEAKWSQKLVNPQVSNKSALKSTGILQEVCSLLKQIRLQLLQINFGIYKTGM